jgi:hypothetical protein
MRTRTGRGFRHPGLIAFAREALTRTKGLIPRVLITAVKVVVAMKINPEKLAAG